MRKRLPLALAFVLILSLLSGCSGNKINPSGQTSGSNANPSSAVNASTYPSINKSDFLSSSSIKLTKETRTALFSFKTPENWGVTNALTDTNPMIYFNYKDESHNDGGVFNLEYNTTPGEKMPGIAALISWALPNHTQVNKISRVTGVKYDAYLIELDQSQPAASGDTTVTHWAYILLVDRSRSNDERFSAIEVALNKELASSADAVKVADSVVIK